jgi:hypothetical protein
VRSGAGEFFRRGTDCLGDRFQPGRVAHRGQDVSGVGSLRDALAYQSGILQAREREVEESVGAVVPGDALAEVGRHAVVEAGIVQLHGQGTFEIDAAADRFCRLPVRQAAFGLGSRVAAGIRADHEGGAPVVPPQANPDLSGVSPHTDRGAPEDFGGGRLGHGGHVRTPGKLGSAPEDATRILRRARFGAHMIDIQHTLYNFK